MTTTFGPTSPTKPPGTTPGTGVGTDSCGKVLAYYCYCGCGKEVNLKVATTSDASLKVSIPSSIAMN